jgi:hypothetical protein
VTWAEQMIFFSLGLTSRFAEWCDAVTTRLACQAVGPIETVLANTIEEFAIGALTVQSPHVLVASRLLAGRLRRALAQANRHFLVAIDDPRLALEDLVRNGMDFTDATRMIANSCASMTSCINIPGALVLHAEKAGTDPAATVEEIARHFEFGVNDTDIANIVHALGDLGLAPQREEIEFSLDRLDEAQRALVSGALEPYVERFAGGDLEPITWERELFFINEDPPPQRAPPASRPADITGRPRFVIFGPYIALPPGLWLATVALGFSNDAAEMSYIVDVYAGTQLAQVRVQPGSERFIEVNLHFAVDESLEQAIEVRIGNELAAFDGRLALGHVTLTPQGYIRGQTRKYLATALSD